MQALMKLMVQIAKYPKCKQQRQAAKSKKKKKKKQQKREKLDSGRHKEQRTVGQVSQVDGLVKGVMC